MEGHSFDELARGLANGTVSRRQALRLVGGALVGAALASVPGVAWARGDQCSEGLTRCGERCVNLRRNERHCGSCFNRCRSTQTCCKGRCVNLQRNERHCGSCFNRCAEGQECVGGECQGGEPAGCTPGTVCGRCTQPDGGTVQCSCADLAGATGTVCFSGGFNSQLCHEEGCGDHPGTVCVQFPETGARACVFPCVDGEPCAG
jgi:stigma-specific protein Stig1